MDLRDERPGSEPRDAWLQTTERRVGMCIIYTQKENSNECREPNPSPPQPSGPDIIIITRVPWAGPSIATIHALFLVQYRTRQRYLRHHPEHIMASILRSKAEQMGINFVSALFPGFAGQGNASGSGYPL